MVKNHAKLQRDALSRIRSSQHVQKRRAKASLSPRLPRTSRSAPAESRELVSIEQTIKKIDKHCHIPSYYPHKPLSVKSLAAFGSCSESFCNSAVLCNSPQPKASRSSRKWQLWERLRESDCSRSCHEDRRRKKPIHICHISCVNYGSNFRLLNHSCRPSTIFQLFRISGHFGIAVVALRDIHHGEEMTVRTARTISSNAVCCAYVRFAKPSDHCDVRDMGYGRGLLDCLLASRK